MDDATSEHLRAIWRQHSIPIVFKRQKPEKLLVKVPPAFNDLDWLRNDGRRIPEWNDKFGAWELPQRWFEKTIKLCINRYKKCYVIQLFREKQVCAPACWNAEGVDCECSCMGENHGAGHPKGRWYEISESFAVSYGIQKYACRLFEQKSQ